VLFPTTDFALFFLVVFLGHWLLNHDGRSWRIFMIGASYVFYAWADWRYVFLLAAVSAISQGAAVWVSRTSGATARMRVLAAGIVATIAPLMYFKYYGFFSLEWTNLVEDAVFGFAPPLVEVVLPVGVSFYTFMAISYVVDVYRGDTEVAATTDLFLYLAFFPHLVAGPIVRANELIPQFQRPRDARHVEVAPALWLIMGGLFKKVVIANFLATAIVDPVFGDPVGVSAPDAIVGLVAYAVQIYGDFSGYTDIAIGIALLLGFRFPENFDRPYAATSVQAFWRTWHMTLSRWLRDYLYIPLGGNRKGRGRTYVNLLITMLLGGLWHGAAWHFVVWGGLHGIYLAVGQWKREQRERGVLATPPDTGWVRAGQTVMTFVLVCIAWAFFRSDSTATALALLGRTLTGWGEPATLVTPAVLLAIAVGLATQFVPRSIGEGLRARLATMGAVPLGLVTALALFTITTMGPRGVAPFIYFQF
jgi:D-alanyl-lipoteichoic acid acyltransferase DltB (MBOAT superfamily)